MLCSHMNITDCNSCKACTHYSEFLRCCDLDKKAVRVSCLHFIASALFLLNIITLIAKANV